MLTTSSFKAHVPVCCSVLQCVAVCCSVLQLQFERLHVSKSEYKHLQLVDHRVL